MGSGTEHTQSPNSEAGEGLQPAGGSDKQQPSQHDHVQGPASPGVDVLAAATANAVAPPPAAFSHRVPHFQQAYNWDCGLACVLMVLRALSMRHHHMGTLLELCPTRSIWTIDLAHLLAACGATTQLTTTTLGANQAYSEERFYAESMEEDSVRVDRLFRTAAAAGISVAQRSVALATLRAALLSRACLLVALVDKASLCSGGCATRPGVTAAGPSLAAAKAAAAAEAGAAQAAAAAYSGHYIVLCGYDGGTDEFEIRDPASVRQRLWVPAARLEAARKRFGTDEDLLVVAVPSPVPADAPPPADAPQQGGTAAGSAATGGSSFQRAQQAQQAPSSRAWVYG